MNWPHQVIGRGGDDGEGQQWRLAYRIAPALPQPSKGDRCPVTTANEVGLLELSFLVPLVEAPGGYQAAVPGQKGRATGAAR